MAGASGVHWAHGPINVISVDFKDSHFEFRVNQELTESHMDFLVSSLDSSSRKHGLRNKNLVSIYPRCWVICENVISLRWRPFWKWRYLGSPSQFSGGGIDFSCLDKSQRPNNIGFVRSWLVHVGYITSIGSIDSLMWFLLVSKAAILNFEFTITKSHRDFSVLLLDSSST